MLTGRNDFNRNIFFTKKEITDLQGWKGFSSRAEKPISSLSVLFFGVFFLYWDDEEEQREGATSELFITSDLGRREKGK